MLLNSLDFVNLDLLVLLYDSIDVNMRYFGVLTIKDLGDLLERHSARFNEEKDDEYDFKEEPALRVVESACPPEMGRQSRNALTQ